MSFFTPRCVPAWMTTCMVSPLQGWAEFTPQVSWLQSLLSSQSSTLSHPAQCPIVWSSGRRSGLKPEALAQKTQVPGGRAPGQPQSHRLLLCSLQKRGRGPSPGSRTSSKPARGIWERSARPDRLKPGSCCPQAFLRCRWAPRLAKPRSKLTGPRGSNTAHGSWSHPLL